MGGFFVSKHWLSSPVMRGHAKFMEQITLQFDASEFESYDTTHEFFQHVTLTTRDEYKRLVKRHAQACALDYAPSQWNHKCNQTNNTSVNLNDLDNFIDEYGDVRIIQYLLWRHVIDHGMDSEIAEMERVLAEAKRRRSITRRTVEGVA